MSLEDKIAHSIEIIRKADKIAKQFGKTLQIGFSGGKDSQTVYQLAKESGVPFEAYFSPTTIDPPEVIRFIHSSYPDVQFAKVETSIYKEAIRRGILPTRVIRWCCQAFKENKRKGDVVLLGVRAAESVKRRSRKELEVVNHKLSVSFGEYELSQQNHQIVNKCLGGGKEQVVVLPIIDWSEQDVLQFLKSRDVELCELYSQGNSRVGCIGCPMATTKARIAQFERWPHAKKKWLETITTMMANGRFPLFEGPEEVFDWWVNNKSVVKYLSDKKCQLQFTQETADEKDVPPHGHPLLHARPQRQD